MVKKYIVSLSEAEQQYLEQIVTTGKRAAYTINHARILLKADRNQANGSWCDQEIKDAFGLSIRTIERVRQRFVEEGLEAVLKCRPGGGRKPKLDGEVEAHLVALRCSETPQGKGRWTLRLLADQMVELGYVEQLSHESVRQVLKKPNCNPGDNRTALGNSASAIGRVCLANGSGVGGVSNGLRFQHTRHLHR